jgi:hypothetical protein
MDSRSTHIPQELKERRQLLRDYKWLDDFIARSKEITEKFEKKVEDIIN